MIYTFICHKTLSTVVNNTVILLITVITIKFNMNTIKCTSNFTVIEINALIALVKKHQSIIECIKTDSVNVE